MKLARVVGTVVSTINAPVFDGRTLLLCDLVEPDGRAAGGYLIAVDTVGAGAGETVLLLDEGTSARQILDAKDAPIRTLVVGIVDHVERAPGEAAGRAAPAQAGKAKPAAAKPAAAKPAVAKPAEAKPAASQAGKAKAGKARSSPAKPVAPARRTRRRARG